MRKIMIATAMALAAALPAHADADGEDTDGMPLRWSCQDGSRISIAEGDGTMTIKRKGAPKVVLPYGSAMSRHQAWNAEGYDSCGYSKGACAIAYLDNEGIHRMSLVWTMDAAPVICETAE